MEIKIDGLQIKMYNIMIDCQNPHKLADFYATLMDWEIHYKTETGDYVMIGPYGNHQVRYPQISFQQNPDYKPPVWPDESGAQQQMMHVDFAVTDLEKAVQHAIHCGASIAAMQYPETSETVMLDPEGHPFCLCPMKKDIFDNPKFALL